MNTLKKIIYLLMITLLISGNSKAQQSVSDQKIISITNFKVYENNTQLIIDWSTDGLIETNFWQIQRSADGQKFSTIALVFGPDPRQQGNRYQYKGKIKDAAGSKAYYKVCPIDANGQQINTEIIQPAK